MNLLRFTLLLQLGVFGLSRKVPAPLRELGPWKYQGCANEVPGMERTLGGPSKAGNMTIGICTAFCAKQDYGMAGLEYGNE